MAKYFGAHGTTLNVVVLYFIMMPTFVWYGYNLAVFGGLLSDASFFGRFEELNTATTSGSTEHFNSNIQGTVSSLYTVGGMLGSLGASFLGDRLGRRRTIFIASLLCLAGAILMASAFSLAQIIVGRLLLGLSAGTVSACVPVYQSEISTPAKRGTHVAYTGFFITAGVLIAFWIDFGFSFIHNSVSWRVPLAIQVILPLMSGSLIFLLPESPHWLVKKGREDEAREIMAIFSETDPRAPEIDEQIAEINSSLAIMKSVKFRDVFSMKETRILHRALLALFSLFCSQACGVNMLTFFLGKLLQDSLGMSPIMAGWLSGCAEVVQPIGAFLAVLTVNKFGRRRLLMTAAIGMGVSMAILAGTTSSSENKKALHAAVAFVFVINLAYAYGFLGVCFVYSAEIAPQRIRTLITGLATFVTWGTNFWVVSSTFASGGWALPRPVVPRKLGIANCLY